MERLKSYCADVCFIDGLETFIISPSKFDDILKDNELLKYLKKSNKDIVPGINISREVGTNKIYLAGALLVIYMIIVITKNILEPKLIAKNLGVTPVLSLVGMYLGMKVMGVIGLIIVPTLLMVIIQILKVKYQLKNKVEIQKS